MNRRLQFDADEQQAILHGLRENLVYLRGQIATTNNDEITHSFTVPDLNKVEVLYNRLRAIQPGVEITLSHREITTILISLKVGIIKLLGEREFSKLMPDPSLALIFDRYGQRSVKIYRRLAKSDGPSVPDPADANRITSSDISGTSIAQMDGST